MKMYEQYKETGYKHIPIIPEHWEVKKHRSFLVEKKDVNSNDEGTLLSLSQYTGVSVKTNTDKQGMFRAESLVGYRIVHPQDIVMNIMLAWNGSTACSKFEGVISPAYAVFKVADNKIAPDYLHYLYRIPEMCGYFKAYSTGIIDSRLRLYPEIFMQLYSVIPSRDEQEQIVRYLDWQVSKINHLIHGYQKQIKLLDERMQQQISYAVLHSTHNSEMIDSGVSFLGAIPSHWKVIQNKHLFKERTEFSKRGDEELLSVSKHYGVKPQSALKDNERFATIKPAESLVGYKTVKKGDLAMNIMRARNGSYGISDYDGIVSPAYCVFEPQIACNPIFLHYFMKTPHVINMFEAYSYGIVEHRRRLYAQEFLRLYSFLPPLDEQDEIAENISNIQSKHKILKEKLQMQLELLKEYMTRLISDVVTGQVDVRDVVIPEYTPEEYTQIFTDDTGEDLEEVAEDAE